MVTYVHATFFKLIFGKKFDHGLRAITKWRWWGWSDDDTVVKVSVLFVKSKHLKYYSVCLQDLFSVRSTMDTYSCICPEDIWRENLAAPQ